MSSYVKDWLSYLRGVRIGTAYSTDGWRMPLDAVDVAWMCRALAGESSGIIGPPSDAVAAVLIQRTYALRDERFERRDGRMVGPMARVWEVALSFAQPINPYWRDRGRDDQIEDRHKYAVMGPAQTEREYPGLIAHVLDIFRGKVSLLPYTGLVDFNAVWVGEGGTGPADAYYGGNKFFYGFGSRSWERGRVKCAPVTHGKGSKLLVPLSLQIGAGLAVAFGPKWGALAAIPILPP